MFLYFFFELFELDSLTHSPGSNYYYYYYYFCIEILNFLNLTHSLTTKMKLLFFPVLNFLNFYY